MPELGTKYECFNCGVKFYDLGKPEPTCPKCGANQKEAGAKERAAETAATRRRRREEVARRVEADEEGVVEGAAEEVEEGAEAPESEAGKEEEAEAEPDDSAY
jgi:uncharacterized protein (TIGR02300 family)